MTPAWQSALAGAPKQRRLGACAVVCLVLAGLLLASLAWAQGEADPAARERKVKAAFRYNFLAYTEFPAAAFGEPGAPLVIAVAGADQLAFELSRIVAGRSVQGRSVQVRSVPDSDTPAGMHLLFVGGPDGACVGGILRSFEPAPVLLVSEADNGLQQGSVINFKLVEEQVRFDVSLEAADRHQVKLSSRLLTVANHVHRGAP